MLVCLAEVDERKLFLEQGYSSLFRYATGVLRMSEAQAFLRIQGTRLAKRYPVVFDLLAQGAVNLSTLKLLDRHLTEDNHLALLERARFKTKDEVQLLVAEIAPQPDVPSRLRKLPARVASRRNRESLLAPRTLDGAATSVAEGSRVEETATQAPTSSSRPRMPLVLEAPPASCAALSPGRFKLELTARQELHDKLKQLQHLLQHQVPGGDLAVVVEGAIDLAIEKAFKERCAQLAKPTAAKPRGFEKSLRQ
jgi:hypothetical protein